MNPKSVITLTIFFIAFNVIYIVDIFVLWLLAITYVIRARLLDNVVMYAIFYVLCLFTWMNIIDVCWLMRVLDTGRLLVVRVGNLIDLK